MKRKLKSLFSLVLSFTLFFGTLSFLIGASAEAKSTRLAIVTEVGGSVYVQSAGGSKSYEAYTDMALNQGDYITTGEDAYIVVKIKDSNDELTIGANSEVYVSDLAPQGSGKKSKIKMWAGSLWASVKKLAGQDDFEVETPTSVMGVQGTKFLTIVDPKTGKTKTIVAAGVVKATTFTTTSNPDNQTQQQNSHTTLLYPTQQISMDSRDETGDLSVNREIVDLEDLISNVSNKIIEAMIKSKNEIDQENDQFIEDAKKKLQDGQDGSNDGLSIKNQDDLDKISKNFDNLIGNIAKEALDKKIFKANELQQIIDDANKKIDKENKKIDLGKVQELDKTAGIDKDKEKQRLEQLKKLKERKDQLEKERAKELADIAKKLADILKAIEDKQKAIQAANEKAKKELKDKANGKSTPTSTPGTPTPGTPTPTETPPGSQTVAVTGVTMELSVTVLIGSTSALNWSIVPSNASNKSVAFRSNNTDVATVSAQGIITGVTEGTATITITTADGAKTATATVTVTKKLSAKVVPGPTQGPTYKNGDKVNIQVDVSGISTGIKGVEIHVTGGLPITPNASIMPNSSFKKVNLKPSTVAPSSDLFTEANSVIDLKKNPDWDSGSTDFIYSAVVPKEIQEVTVGLGVRKLVNIPFYVIASAYEASSEDVKFMISVTLNDASGHVIETSEMPISIPVSLAASKKD